MTRITGINNIGVCIKNTGINGTGTNDICINNTGMHDKGVNDTGVNNLLILSAMLCWYRSVANAINIDVL